MKTLYHGTTSVNLACIKAIGLVPGHAKGGDTYAKEHHMSLVYAAAKRKPSVFVTDQQDRASDFAQYATDEMGGDPVVITFHVPDDVFATFTVDELFEGHSDYPHAWRPTSIPATYIVAVTPVPKEPDFRDLILGLAAELHIRL